MNNTPPYPTTPPGSPPNRLMTLGSPLLNVSNVSRRNSNNFSNANNILGNLSGKNKAYSTSRSLNSSNFYNRNRSTTAPRNNNNNNSRNNNNNKRNVNYKASIGKLNRKTRKSRSTRRTSKGKRNQSRK